MIPTMKCTLVGLMCLSSGLQPVAAGVQNQTACASLARRFPDQTSFPGSANYVLKSETDIFSETCHLHPGCVFLPSNASDVSEAVSIVRDARETFSVLSGGHMPVPGAQSNDGGVQIALANLNSKDLNSDNSVASIGPGSRWVEVYSWLQPYGLSVAGGRYSTVGVGGVLVGGGINYFGNRVGFSVNTLVGMQVVLGDGSVVEVSGESHPDLFWALKGGNNNFGIVTRFDLETIPIDGAWGGIAGWTGKDAADQMIQAMDDFLFSPEGIGDLYTEINPSITISPNTTDDASTWLSVFVPFVAGNYSDEVPRSVANFTAIPNPLNVSVLGQEDNYVELLNQVQERNTQDVYGLGQIYGTLSAKLVPGIVQLAVDTVLTPALTELANVTGAFAAVSPEPISHLMVEAAAKSGPYAIDLDPADGSFLIILTTVTWTNPADNDYVAAYMRRTLQRLEDALVEKDLLYDYIYINDASPEQYPYSTYGKGKSVARMKEIQASYDQFGVFKDLITSGYKL